MKYRLPILLIVLVGALWFVHGRSERRSSQSGQAAQEVMRTDAPNESRSADKAVRKARAEKVARDISRANDEAAKAEAAAEKIEADKQAATVAEEKARNQELLARSSEVIFTVKKKNSWGYLITLLAVVNPDGSTVDYRPEGGRVQFLMTGGQGDATINTLIKCKAYRSGTYDFPTSHGTIPVDKWVYAGEAN
jgi:hypothetical protein